MEKSRTEEFRKVPYRADIDGLRAIAVLAVLLFHVDLGFPGGYTGVDVFFVISGYLISSIVVNELEQQRFSLRKFWLRRIRRIVPMQIVVSICVLMAGCLLMLPSDLQALASSALAQLGLSANIWFWRNTDYFAGPAELKPLLHTWSLAVEEQFYLIFPFVISILWRWMKRGGLTYVFLVAFGVSFLLNLYLVERSPSATFFLLPTRAWELMAGILVALMPARQWSVRTANLMASLGLTAIVYSFLAFDAQTVFPGLAATLPVGGTAMLIAANAGRETLVARILRWRVLVFTGLISYSLYLWHWPLIAFYRYHMGPMTTAAAVIIVATSYSMAVFTWWCVEQPVRRRTWFGQPRRLVLSAGVGLVATFLVAAVAGYDGMRWRLPASVLRVIEQPNWHAQKSFAITEEDVRHSRLPEMGIGRDTSTDRRFMLWGDSYAGCIAELVDGIAAEQGVSGYFAGRGGTPPLPQAWTHATRDSTDEAVNWNEFCLRFVAENRVQSVLLVAAWDIHIRGMSHLTDSIDRQSGAHDASDVFRRSFKTLVERLEAAGVEIHVVLQVPYQHQSVPVLVARDVLRGNAGDTYGVNRERHEAFQQECREYFREFGDRINLIDVSENCLTDDGRTLIGRNGVPLYVDTGHLSAAGAQLFLEQPVRAVMQSLAVRKSDPERAFIFDGQAGSAGSE